ncbi:MAG: ribosomal RNA small subunit methyltransferase A [Phycisphaeraceae bacterium]|nr:ribosomal RNA small subunit methyltransferase A [Phycisphaeraceae bacterium]
MQTLAQIKQVLETHGLTPKKSLGQNFLIDQNLIRKLVDACGVKPGDLVLEVGPGTGTLTEELLSRGCDVVACELDDHLSAILAERAHEIPGGERLTVVHADCLSKERELSEAVRSVLRRLAAGRGFRLVANLPYGAATPLLTTLLLDHPACSTMGVTIQREVADRLLAKPGTKEYGGLTVIAQSLARVTRIATLPRECFWPRPEVTSTMVLLERSEAPRTSDPAGLSEFCRVIFAQRRKQLGSLLSAAGVTIAGPWPEGVSPSARAEQLSIEQIESLRRIAHRGPPPAP